MNNTIPIRLTITYISFLITLLFWSSEVAFFWIIVFLILGNVRFISKDIFICRFTRLTLYFVPFLLPIFFKGISFDFFGVSWELFCIPLVIGGIYVFLGRKGYRIMLDSTYLFEIKTNQCYNQLLFIYNYIFAAISEELFFRYYLLNTGTNLFLSVLFSCFLFVCYHYTQPWGDVFTKKDLCRQFTIGMINCLLFICFGSIVPCIVLHLCCNIPEIILNIKIILINKGVIKVLNEQQIDIDF